ncbi:MAG: eukaryotic-like serine/threonine-protein kinase [Ilumatobacteraceae bacterium]|nr:eukaryotic-like serine/threonine-protein kinase [Ilumatobacteraceae bacterium]
MVMDTQFNGRVVAGRYKLGPRRGSGVDAAVFDAFDLVERRVVAMKVVHPDLSDGPGFERAFRFAAEQGASIKHPNIAEIYDWGADVWNDRKAMFVVVEHVGGGSLREYLDRGRTLSPSQALMVGLDACKGLDVIHRRGLTHGDIRPSTLVFGDDQRLRLTDVGLANVVGEALWTDRAHVSNALAMYASPELAEDGDRGPKGDVYSLCLTMLESMSGSVPFAGDSTVATLGNRIGRLMPVSADLGPLAAVLERAGRPLPGDRYSAAEFGRALVQAAEKLPRPAPISLPNAGLFGDSSGSIARPPVPQLVPLEAEPSLVSAPGGAQPPSPPIESPPATEPVRRRRTLLWILPLLLVLAGAGVGAAYLATRNNTSTHVVPHLAGLTEAESLNQISGFGWQAAVSREASDDVPAGVVIRTQPGEATVLEKNKPFQLIVSTGPAPRRLPDLVGLALDQASAQLDQLGLVLAQAPPIYDETVPAGIVISWMVPEQPGLKAGDTVTPKTTVSVVLSQGPQPRVVPDLTGMSIDEATAALATQGLLLVQVEPQFSNTVAAGLIMAQDLSPTTNVDRGSTVSVAVSKGPDVVAVVPLANLTLQQATDALTAAGLAVGTVNGNPDGVLVGAQYQGADILPGQLLPRNSAIDITLA